MSKTATQLTGHASSIFQAWLNLKQQSGFTPPNTDKKEASYTPAATQLSP